MQRKRADEIKRNQLERAQRLRGIWDAKRAGLGITQKSVAQMLGWQTQGAVGHVLSGNTPLTIDLLLDFCRILKVAPETIVPELREVASMAPKIGARTANVADVVDLNLIVLCVKQIELAANSYDVVLDEPKKAKLVEFLYLEMTTGQKPVTEANLLADRLVELASVN